ncbi:hypothetical protein HNQ02_003494 [Flavobacterium sp. 7E]|uniref:hypothetical protein n=1 Tax=Flavobacterium sp. 7E TaxID=2735898 RepID=UPI0020C6B31C|nr:hypothetical protein [Flavobacterium sp. 7E]NRS90549.1 hypothetical protein [Flavobacterium sp. 7E]
MYKYYFRPEYGSKNLLIEFFNNTKNDNFIPDLLNTIVELEPKITDITDLWMNAEIIINIESNLGEFFLSKDIWDLAFLIAENNQKCLSRITQY